MNNPVSFELAKLLKEKGFNEKPFYIKSNTDYIEGYNFDVEDENDSLKVAEFQFEDNVCSHLYLKPTIAEVVMWLYKKYKYSLEHSLEIPESGELDGCYVFKGIVKGSKDYKLVVHFTSENLPSMSKAYEAAIEYTLKNLI